MQDETNRLIEARRKKVELLREAGINPYPTTIAVTHSAYVVAANYGNKTAEELEQQEHRVTVAGRVKALRDFGSSIFADVFDYSGKIQVLLNKKLVGPDQHQFFKKNADIGDIFGFTGRVFKTRTGELTVAAENCTLLCKSVRPLPEKWHGLTDKETRYRQRYADLIMNPDIVNVFRTRSEIIRLFRVFFQERDFLEVETPMMQPIAGGANARPFKTFHNALSMDLFLRIAPELYLKRLVVGGLDRVFEINRNFRNEGISTQHNPEFTMLEFYWAYATYEQLMDLTEELFCFLAQSLFQRLDFPYQDLTLDFTRPWRRLKMSEAVLANTDLTAADLAQPEKMANYCRQNEIELAGKEGAGRLLTYVFEKKVEHLLVQPTFIHEYPAEVSPLARRNDVNPEVVDRFELYICGREIANAFNELNDPDDQRERFMAQMEAKRAGDEEAHEYDADYLRALEYGLPPTAGEGIGIDRVVMLFTNQISIRDVLLFPLLRKETS